MNVFISSVVSGFEHYRAAARKAVLLLGHNPMMCEEFGARPYSSQHAWMTEVDQADVVIVILAASFGYQAETGDSVTQQEFRRARAAGKPILVFLENVPMEKRQHAFSPDVSDYIDGLFRATFSDQHELLDGIIRALNHLTVNRKAISEVEFARRLLNLGGSSQWSSVDQKARLEISFLPQPEIAGTLRVAHAHHESFFLRICQSGLDSIKGGYKDFDSFDQTGIDTTGVKWRHHESGMSLLSILLDNPVSSHNVLNSYFLSPSKIRRVAEAALSLLSEGKGGWFQIGLYGFGQKILAEPPVSTISSISVPFRSEHFIEERVLLIPATPSVYRRWLDEVMFRIQRKMSV